MGTQKTPRQKKIAAALQKELSTMLQETIREQGITNLLVSVTKVYVTIDLSLAKIFLSIFPKNKAKKYLNGIQENAFQINCDLASRMRNQLRRMPKFYFYIDDSLDYVEEIENALKKSQNPIDKTEFLSEKQKNK
jgi:ribosome-binding factor A